MKVLFCMFLSLTGILVYAQERETILEINSSLASIPCEDDVAERTVVLEHIVDGGRKPAGRYQGAGCNFTVSAKLPLGKYSMSISGLAFQEETLNFEITENTKDRLVIPSVALKQKINTLDEVTVYGPKGST
jgi:hypothetical protein